MAEGVACSQVVECLTGQRSQIISDRRRARTPGEFSPELVTRGLSGSLPVGNDVRDRRAVSSEHHPLFMARRIDDLASSTSQVPTSISMCDCGDHS